MLFSEKGKVPGMEIKAMKGRKTLEEKENEPRAKRKVKC